MWLLGHFWRLGERESWRASDGLILSIALSPPYSFSFFFSALPSLKSSMLLGHDAESLYADCGEGARPVSACAACAGGPRALLGSHQAGWVL